MHLLPYRNIELDSPLTAAEAMQAVENAVEPKRWFRFGSGTRPFEGTVTQSEFDIQRIISYRNSFLPQIRGLIRSATTGSRISLAMRLHPAVAVFMFIWIGGVLVGGIAALAAVSAERASIAPALIPLGMLFVGWALTVGGFSVEAKKAEHLLAGIVRGRRRAADALEETAP